MENKKFEELIDLIINENEDKARELFHEIVVEKSREIYENMMDEEMSEGMGGQTGSFLDEISAEVENEEAGGIGESAEDEALDDLDSVDQDETDVEEFDAADAEDKAEDLEDRVADVEDKLDELMAEFDQILAGDSEEEAGKEVVDLDQEDEEEMMEEEHKDEDDAVEEGIMEATELKKVAMPKGGDDGANKKSPTLNAPRVKAEGVKPVNFTQGGDEKVPTKPADPKGHSPKDLPGAGSFKNVPGGSKAKLDNAPKPKHGDDGANKVSPVAKK